MFQTQNDTEQVDHLHTVAEQAIAAWGITASALTLIAYTNNAVFRVETPDGDYALRVHRPGGKPLAWIESERAWLRALAEDLRVPRPVGEVYRGHLRGYDGDVYASRAIWLDGEPRPLDDLRPHELERIGALAAQLHNVSSRFNAPPGFIRPRYDWDGLFSERSAYHPGDGMRYFDAELRALIDHAAERVRETMDMLGTSEKAFGLIHGDLIAKNILFAADGKISLVDFDDCATGYYLYDLTPLIWLARGSSREQAVRDALWAGYVRARPQPEPAREHLRVFVMARHIASLRWVAGHADHPALRGKVSAILAERKIELEAMLQRTG